MLSLVEFLKCLLFLFISCWPEGSLAAEGPKRPLVLHMPGTAPGLKFFFIVAVSFLLHMSLISKIIPNTGCSVLMNCHAFPIGRPATSLIKKQFHSAVVPPGYISTMF